MASDDTALSGDPAPDDAAPDNLATQDPDDARPARYVKFSRKVADAVCARIAAGETQRSVCADRAMPSIATLRVWARERPAFGRAFARARAMGGSDGRGRVSTYDPLTALEIVARVSEGETLTGICDPAMPAIRTVFLWRREHDDFEDELRMAREAAAERFSDLGWKRAMEATPETAYLTQVRLNQLRWQAALMGPRTHGRMRAGAAPEPREALTVLQRHFKLETHPETGQTRVVGYCPDPDTMQPVRDAEGPWRDPPPALAAEHAAFQAKRAEAAAAARRPVDPNDPEGWC